MYVSGQTQYLAGIGIDPDLPISDSVGDRRTSLALRPSGYATFSSTNVTANPYWLSTSPKTALLYAYLNNGRLVSYNSSFASETLIGTASSSSGNGMAYYNNYLYLATNTNISRYGPLDGTAALTDSVWTGTTLGSKTALVNTTYPSIRGSGTLPNHPMHVHVDNKVYVGDFDSTSTDSTKRGRGLIHAIKTKYGSSEGDTNDNSAYIVLKLPYGFMPTDIESYGNDLVIAAIQTANSTLNQGRAALFFWDTIADSFYNQVWLPDPLVTALLNNNGILYIFSGVITTGANVSNGYRVSYYAGGQSIKQIYYSNTGSSPLPGAVDAFGDRIVWGTFEQLSTTTTDSPNYYAVVNAFGSKDGRIPGGVHGIINAKAPGTAEDGIVTCVKNVQQSSFSYPKLAVGWRAASTFGIDNQSTTYGTSVFRYMVNVGQPFLVKKVSFNTATAIAANMTLTPTIYLDDFSSSSTSGLTVVNSTNYSGGQRHIVLYPTISGDHNFCLELQWTGIALFTVLLPIEIEFDLLVA